MLGRLEMSTEQALDAYDAFASEIFSKKNKNRFNPTEKYRAKALEKSQNQRQHQRNTQLSQSQNHDHSKPGTVPPTNSSKNNVPNGQDQGRNTPVGMVSSTRVTSLIHLVSQQSERIQDLEKVLEESRVTMNRWREIGIKRGFELR